MSLKIERNTIDILLEVFEKSYPETVAKINKISFAKLKSGYALTEFAEDGINIYISSTQKQGKPINFEIATELLAHELAHAIVGIDDGHGEKWEAAFSELQKLYYEKAKKTKEEK